MRRGEFKRAWMARASEWLRAQGAEDPEATAEAAWFMSGRGRARAAEWRGSTVRMEALFDTAWSDKSVVGGYGSMFRADASDRNWPGIMLEELTGERARTKREMFERMEAGDKAGARMLDTKQKVLKVVANSWYGVANTPRFPLYDFDVGATITHTGVALTTSALVSLELFMAGNRPENSGEAALKRLADCLADGKRLDDPPEPAPGADEVADWHARGLDGEDAELVRNAVKRLSPEEIARIAWKDRLLDYLRADARTRGLLERCLDAEDFVDPSDPPESVRGFLSSAWERIRAAAAVPAPPADAGKSARTMTRRAVLVADTDSVFAHLAGWLEVLAEWGRRADGPSDPRKAVWCCVFASLASEFLKEAMEAQCAAMGSPEKVRGRISMKSEFLYSRLLTTPNRKQYAGLVVNREGNILSEPELDVKGLAVKKVGVSQAARDFFSGLLENDVLKGRPDRAGLLGKVLEFKERVGLSLASGSLEFCGTRNHRSAKSYAEPWKMEQHRGVRAWNMLHPNDAIEDFEKVDFLKMRCPRREDAVRLLGEENAKRLDGLYDHPEGGRFGFTALSLPKGRDSVPDWLAPAVDVEAMTRLNMSAFHPVLQAVGFPTIPDDEGRPQVSRFIIEGF